MTDKQLSSQAQAIVDAYESTADKYKALAAVLQSIADQVAPIEVELVDDCLQYEAHNPIREQLFTIIEELEQF